MKALFTSDHAAWLFLASLAGLIPALITGWAPAVAVLVLTLYASFDVLGYKWVLNFSREILVLVGSPPTEVDLDEDGRCTVDHLPWYISLPDSRKQLATAAYRLFQHGLMLPVLALAWICAGWEAAVAPLIVWITFGADILYYWVSRSELPPWESDDYFGFGYWSGPFGWAWWIVWYTEHRDELIAPMPAWGLYLQAIAGFISAVWVLI